MPTAVAQHAKRRFSAIAPTYESTGVLKHVQTQRVTGRVGNRDAQLVLFRARFDQLARIGTMPGQQRRQRPRRAQGACDELLGEGGQ